MKTCKTKITLKPSARGSAVVAVASMLLLCAGCSVGSKHDKLIVKDAKGNLYELKHNIGDTYFIRSVDTNQLQATF